MTENSKQVDWKTVDNALRVIAKRRAELDAQEARWLRKAISMQVWKPLGMVSMLDYMERVLHYEPHTAGERVRVAKALGELPELAEALARGDLSYSGVREVSRI